MKTVYVAYVGQDDYEWEGMFDSVGLLIDCWPTRKCGCWGRCGFDSFAKAMGFEVIKAPDDLNEKFRTVLFGQVKECYGLSGLEYVIESEG